MFKKLFGRNEQKAPVSRLAMVRNITVGRTVALDPLAWRRLGDETHFTLDRDVLAQLHQITARRAGCKHGHQNKHQCPKTCHGTSEAAIAGNLAADPALKQVRF